MDVAINLKIFPMSTELFGFKQMLKSKWNCEIC
jgi:hypothetical protein